MRARVQSGGARKGAYQAGVCLALEEAGQGDYDLEAGVSCGSLGAYYLAQGHSAESWCDIWRTIDTHDVYRDWFFGWLQGVFKGSLYDSRPLLKLIQKHGALLTRQLRVGAVSLETGEYVACTENSPEYMLQKHVWASCAQPLIMTAPRVGGMTWTDGGVRTKTPLKAAIDAGATTVDVISTTPIKGMSKWAPGWWERRFKLFGRTLREIQIAINEAHSNDLQIAKWINHAVLAGAPEADGKRFIELRIFAPPESLDVVDFDFDPKVSARLIEQGYHDAQRQLRQGAE